MEQTETAPKEFIGPLSKRERRVLGVLIEKSLTTPEYYPLTLKALATGCNQKNNRSPLSSYDKFDIEDTLDALRTRGLIAAVQTAGGRTERYRHLLRDATGWGQKQLAIMGELLLRGKQQTGELRTRASRMSTIESQEELREELERLLASGYVQANGELQRRGIDVDHALYLPEENKTLAWQAAPPVTSSPEGTPHAARTASAEHAPTLEAEPPARTLSNQQPADTTQIAELQAEIEQLKSGLAALTDRVSDLERQLGL